MKIARTIAALRKLVIPAKKKGKTIGFVATMGYLHEGHLSLIRQAKKDCDICVVSIFVNPFQFGPREDFQRYPRDIKRDVCLSKSSGADIIFYPSARLMYPSGYSTFVEVKEFSEVLCGRGREGHFKGVTTVVAKLFNITAANISYFGQKDAQQAVIIQKMVRDLNMPVKIKVMPIIRENNGLAISSRNVYLSPEERKEAVILWQSLRIAKRMIKKGKRSSWEIISSIKKLILTKKTAKIDYVECVDMQTLKPLKRIKGKVLIALAVWLGKTRLIDNIIAKAQKKIVR